ncbi:DUF6544 family protein [Demequina sp.]|uniref:DUF6544 family protein n=1 Tax=Demequina sp. TaxID=2050685 RepID=UPI003A85D6D5
MNQGPPSLAIPRAARQIAAEWHWVAAHRDPLSPIAAQVVDTLPVPVKRWISHSVPSEVPLSTTASIGSHGRIRVGAWRPYTARQVIAAGVGFVWSARARIGPVAVTGFDRYTRAEGQMRWRLGGVIPVVAASDADVTRSAAGRLASELVLTPAAALHPAVAWAPVDEHRAIAHIHIDGTAHGVEIDVDQDGLLRTVRVPRWGNPDRGAFAMHNFVVRCEGVRDGDGFRLPARMEAGWNLDQGGEPFIEMEIDSAVFH